MRGRKFGRIGCIYERGMRRRGFGSLRSRISSGEFFGRVVNAFARPST
jgi:hypothetical protein